MHVPYTPNLGRFFFDFHTARERLQLLDPSPQDLARVDVRIDFEELFAHHAVRFGANLIPILFDNCARGGIARRPRPSCCGTCEIVARLAHAVYANLIDQRMLVVHKMSSRARNKGLYSLSNRGNIKYDIPWRRAEMGIREGMR